MATAVDVAWDARVQTSHSYTGRMCAASRYIESQRRDSIFSDPLAELLAGRESINDPMGAWILVPRTRYGDDLLERRYHMQGPLAARQLVLLGAGMDARAYRMNGMPELRVFEVDQKTTFDVKEPLIESSGAPLLVKERHVVATDFDKDGAWHDDLLAAGFSPEVPTVWLLEGLLMYLSAPDTKKLMRTLGSLSAPGSYVFHDAVSGSYLKSRISVAGAPFIGGSDDYGALWKEEAAFQKYFVRDFGSISVDRYRRKLVLDDRVPEASPGRIRGDKVVLFVEAECTA